MLPAEIESQFRKIIRTRIVSEARRIQNQIFDNVIQLTKYLEQFYGPSKNVYQLQGGAFIKKKKKKRRKYNYVCKSGKMTGKTNIRSI